MRTAAQPLRPVLLITVTTILGLMPMVLGVNIDLMTREITLGGPCTQWWAQLATAVAAGLAFATLLTLILTSCLLVLGGQLKRQQIYSGAGGSGVRRTGITNWRLLIRQSGMVAPSCRVNGQARLQEVNKHVEEHLLVLGLVSLRSCQLCK